MGYAVVISLVVLLGGLYFGSTLPKQFQIPVGLVVAVVAIVIAVTARKIEHTNKEINSVVHGIDCRTGKTYTRSTKEGRK